MGEYTTINPNSDKKRAINDVYLTPRGMAKATLDLLPERFIPKNILDPGMGTGIWGEACYNKWNVKSVGVEIRSKENTNAKYSNAYRDTYYEDDFTHYTSLYPKDWQVIGKYDLVIGNPPFSLAEDFIRESFRWLAPKGYLVLLLRLAYLASEKRYLSLWKDYPLKELHVSSRRPSFYYEETGAKGTDGEEYAIFVWQKEWKENYYVGKNFYWNY